MRQRLTLGNPVLPPSGFALARAARSEIGESKPGKIGATLELYQVNRLINATIKPQPDGLVDAWTIDPPAGDCDDYALTKRHHLLARGWPSSALMLATCVTRSGEGHCVLIARLRDRDVVLDNLTDSLLSPMASRHRFIACQDPDNPRRWRSATLST